MSITAAQVAEGVKLALNSGSFSKEFVAKRVYIPLEKLEDLSDVIVAVVPSADEWTGPIARRLKQNEISVTVGVLQHLPQGTDPTNESGNEWLDTMVAFTKELASSFGPGKLSIPNVSEPSPTVEWTRTINDPIYDPERLRADSVFFSLITVAYLDRF